MKKIYSLNLISFLRSKGHKELEIGCNEENGKAYYVFEELDAITNLIKEYKNPKVEVVLHDFVANFKNIKKEIHQYKKDNEQ